MPKKATLRTIVTVAAALGVITLFAGSAAAIGTDSLPGGDDTSAPVGVTIDLDGDASSSGGGGGGVVEVTSDQGEGSGNGAVSVNDEPEANVNLGGEGNISGNAQEVGIDCTLNQTTAQDPQSVCETTPSSDGVPPEDSPIPPENFPPEDSPIPPENFPPENSPVPVTTVDGLLAL